MVGRLVNVILFGRWWVHVSVHHTRHTEAFKASRNPMGDSGLSVDAAVVEVRGHSGVDRVHNIHQRSFGRGPICLLPASGVREAVVKC